jgi:hypothetical protein
MENAHVESLIRKKLTGYIAGRITRQVFTDWFIPATWDIEEWAPASLQDLVNAVKGRLAEYDDGHWAEDRLREQLAILACESSGMTFYIEPGEFTLAAIASPSSGSTKFRTAGSIGVKGEPPRVVGVFNHAQPVPWWAMQRLSEPLSVAAPGS